MCENKKNAVIQNIYHDNIFIKQLHNLHEKTISSYKGFNIDCQKSVAFQNVIPTWYLSNF